jgi:hypothetical protein
MRIEFHNHDGQGSKRTQVYDLPIISETDYWLNVTDVPCPIQSCDGAIRWHEAGYAPGYRICDKCKRHFLAQGGLTKPVLHRMGTRKG